uniref:Uncharacterized protein n=1 Tax=Glycine max TaxID=3847 RepID=K7K3H9_SOYBN
MADMAVSIAREKLLPLIRDEANLIWDMPKEFADLKDELEYIQAFLKDADKRAAGKGDNMKEGIRNWIKSFVHGIKQKAKDYQFQIQPSSEHGKRSHKGSQVVQWHDPRTASRYLEEAEVVGIEGPRDELIGWLVGVPAYRTVISVVGMGGLGKTTLVNRIQHAMFDNKNGSRILITTRMQEVVVSCKGTPLDHGVTLTKILGFGYDDLPYHLKFCLLYFEMYPKDYEHISNEDESMSSGMIQHLSIAITSNDLMESIESSCTWSLFVFSLEESTISNNYVLRIPTKYRLLKVLDFEDGELSFVPGNCGNLAHLRYFSIRNIWRARLGFFLVVVSLLLWRFFGFDFDPLHDRDANSWLFFLIAFVLVLTIALRAAHYCTICSNSGDASEGASNMALGKSNPPDIDEDLHSRQLAWLQNLETLDIRNTMVTKMPKEICKHRKLRHLLGDEMTLFQLKNSLRGMTSLQTLHQINKDGDVIKLIRELRKLKQLRNLGVMDVKEEQGSTLCSSINEIQNLEKLNIVDDPLKSLQNMSQLLFLAIGSMSYEGKNLYFQDGGIQQLKELRLKYLYNLDSIVIYKGALHSLRKLQFREIPQLNTVPLGIQHLKKLEV